MKYKHTQIGYLIIIITLIMLVFFAWLENSARAESPLYDSGANFAITSTMVSIIFILASFFSLQVNIDQKHLRIKFGYGIYQKKFLLQDMISAKAVKNRWYYGWGIKVCFWPKMWIYNVSGFDAVEIVMKNGRIYRIGTDEPKKLEQAIAKSLILIST